MVGYEIKKLRKEKGLSQTKLSALTGISQSKISAFELHKKDLSALEIKKIINSINLLNSKMINRLNKKRYVYSSKQDKIVLPPSRTKEKYKTTPRNREYLNTLKRLEKQFTNKPKFKAISFFAGCGGLCYGMRSAGFEIIATNELVEAYKDIYKLNFPNAQFLSNDITKISDDELQKVLTSYSDIDVMLGGPPCQGFSLAGKRDVSDKRNSLFNNYLHIAKVIKPKIIVMENVRLLNSMKDEKGNNIGLQILKSFEKAGYNSRFFIVNMKNYGVPQHRERIIFIGVRKDINKAPSIPSPIFNTDVDLFSGQIPCFTFGDATSDLEYLESGEQSETDKLHQCVKHPNHVIKWLINVPEGKSAHENEDINLRPPSGYNTTYKRQVWSQPGATVGTTFGMISGSRNVHPIATRSLTVREAMRLQSFPDSFQFLGKLGDIRSTIGNAVPPIFAYHLGRFIKETYIL